jgi:2-polyprenyl-6-methoxyphenol hydroxylase-like FAD-dependent oxidoreductase
MDIAIVGGGIGGLTLALALHQRGIPCRVYESAPAVKELGVGITLLPHAMREMTALGLGEVLTRQGIENRDSCFFNRFGQLIYAEPRGRFAGHPFPEVGIHRGRLHLTLWNAAVARLGAERILTDHQGIGLDQTDQRVTLHFRSGVTGASRAPVEARRSRLTSRSPATESTRSCADSSTGVRSCASSASTRGAASRARSRS